MSNQQHEAAKLSTNPAAGGQLGKIFSSKREQRAPAWKTCRAVLSHRLKWLSNNGLTRFALTGGVVCLFDLMLIGLFRTIVPPLVAVSVAYPLAVTLHFCLNKWWVFQDAEQVCSHQVGRYVLTVLACWLMTVGVVAGVTALGQDVIFAKLWAIPPTTLFGFGLMRRFVFGCVARKSAGQ